MTADPVWRGAEPQHERARARNLHRRVLKWWQTLAPQYKKLLWGLGASLGLIVVILAIIWAIIWIPQRQLAPLKAKIQRERGTLTVSERLKLEHDARKFEQDARSTVVQAFGGLALFIGLVFTAKTWWTTREGQITDRFTKAINQLGETGPEKLAIRLGGIYALERIARDSKRDHWPIMEVLTAYVREHARWNEAEQHPREEISPGEPQPLQSNQSLPTLATDIQAILTVLGRRARTYGKGEDQRLSLARTDLRGAVLVGAHLQGASLWEAHLERAGLVDARLEGVTLTQAHLDGAFLVNAHLEGVDLWRAHLEGAKLALAHLKRAALWDTCLQDADLERAHLEGANLLGAHLQGANLLGAHLQGAENLTVEQLSTVKTLYDAHLDPPLLAQIQQQHPRLLKKPPQYRCCYCGAVEPVDWVLPTQRANTAILFSHLIQDHPNQVGPYRERIRMEDFDTVVAEAVTEAYEVVEE